MTSEGDRPTLLLSAEPLRTPTVLDLPSGQPVVQIHHESVTMGDLAGHFDQGFGLLAGLGPVGPGYAIYGGDVSARFDLTIGFPVAAPPPELPDGVTATTFTAGRALVVSHLGSYDGLGAAWEELMQHPDAAGRAGGVEIYVSDPSQVATEDLRTDLVVPLG